ncbi:C39 family peptidase [Thermodesulfovibrio sp. 3907-1M]|uniref:C39 family peptidase n=1 Tax=Thermodesulfovibrio autotrophicus TaxID=3118333 RepID=A0AAU8GWK9_9BACT
MKKNKKMLLLFTLVVLISAAYAQEYIISSVPFFPSEDFQCGPASLAMVLNFWGLRITPEEIAKDIYSKTARGTADFDMLIFAEKKGFKASQYSGNIEDIKEKIKAQKPLIVMTDEGFWFYKKYHYMVIVGFDKHSIIVNSGTEQYKRIDFESFAKKWKKTDFWTLLIEK